MSINKFNKVKNQIYIMKIVFQLGYPGAAPAAPGVSEKKDRGINGKYILIIMAVILVIAVVYVVYTILTGGDPLPPSGPECGNGLCETSENYNNCPADCLQQQPPAENQSFFVSPQTQTISAGNDVTVEVKISEAGDLFGYQFNLEYDSSVLEFKEATEGSFLNENGGADTFFIEPSIPSPGLVKNVACVRKGQIGGLDGEGTLVVIKFTALSAGTSQLTLSNVMLSDSHVQATLFESTNGEVVVQ